MDSVFIGKRPVATTGTGHAGVSKTDMIIVNNKPPAKDYVNDARSWGLTGGPVRTRIRGEKIWTEESVVPTFQTAPKEPTGIGICSGTWFAETKAKSSCKTVFVEGQRVIRLDDETEQNHSNCIGKVVTGAEADAIVAERNARGANAGAGADTKPPDAPKANNGGSGTGSGTNNGNNQGNQEVLTWIELRFVPDPASPTPTLRLSAGESSAYHSYRLVSPGRPPIFGILDLNRGSSERFEGVQASQFCELDMYFPKFPEGAGLAMQGVFSIGPVKLAPGMTHTFNIINEVPRAANFIASRMTANASVARTYIRPLNEQAPALWDRARWLARQAVLAPSPLKLAFCSAAVACATAALTLYAQALATWALLVGPGRPWDYKPTFLGQRRDGPNLGAWHTWGEWEYHHEVWSNIAFGYVGREAGFSDWMLLFGADLAQQLDNKKNAIIQDGKEALKSGNVSDLIRHLDQALRDLLRPFPGDTDQDAAAIYEGYRISSVSAGGLINLVENMRSPEVVRRAHSYDNAKGDTARGRSPTIVHACCTTR